MNLLPTDENEEKGPNNIVDNPLNGTTGRIAQVLHGGKRDKRDLRNFRNAIKQVPPGSSYIIEFNQEPGVNVGGQKTVTRDRGILRQEPSDEG